MTKNSSSFFKKLNISKNSVLEIFSAPKSKSKEPLFFLIIERFALSRLTEVTLNLPKTKSTKENLVFNELKDKNGSFSEYKKSTLLIVISGSKLSSNDK